MKRFAPLALIAALALNGCVSAEPSAESTPVPAVKSVSAPTESPTPTAKPTPTKAVDKSQAWADDMINLFLNGNGAASFKGFTEGSAQREITSWSSPERGVLKVITENGNWDEASIEHVGWDVMSKAGWGNPELKLVQVTTEDESVSFDYTRSMVTGMK